MHIANYLEPEATEKLIHELFNADNIQDYFTAHERELKVSSFAAYITNLCRQRNMTVASTLENADISFSYGYFLFSGKRKPSHDTVLKLAIAFGLNLEETQQLLSAAGFGGLYPKIKRDAVIIYAIQRQYSLFDLQEELSLHHLTELGAADHDRR